MLKKKVFGFRLAAVMVALAMMMSLLPVTAPVSAAEPDTARFNFENGNTHGFSIGDGGHTITLDSSKAYAGENSLRLDYTSEDSFLSYAPNETLKIPASSEVVFRIFVPEDFTGAVQSFVMDENWGWIANDYKDAAALVKNAWNEISMQTPADADEGRGLGLRTYTKGTATEAGAIWIDSIDIIEPPKDNARFNFENGETYGFELFYEDQPENDSFEIDSTKAYAGTSSLKLNYTGEAYLRTFQQIDIPIGSEFVFEIFIPEDFKGDIHPFILAGSNWQYIGDYVVNERLVKDEWNEIKLNFTGPSPCNGVFFEVIAEDTASGTLWIDSIDMILPVKGEYPVTPTEAAITIDKNKQYQKIDGFGAFGGSTPNWGHQDSLHTQEFVDMIIEDLGASIIRTELAGNFEKYNDNDDPYDTDLSKFNIDEHYGEEQEQAQLRPWLNYVMAAKDKADSLNQDLEIITTIWSPPYWMKYVDSYHGQDETWNRLSNGVGPVPGVPGEKANMYPEYAEYLYAYTQIFKEETGFDLYGLSFQNEPAFPQGYPSTVYSPEQYRDMLIEVGKRFEKENVNVKLFGAEDVQVPERIRAYLETTAGSEEARKYLDVMAVHGYKWDGVSAGDTDEAWSNTRDMAAAYNYPLWMTETSGYPGTWKGAMDLANSIHSALYNGHVNAWVWWSFVGMGGDDPYTLIENGVPQKKFYTSKNYYKFVRPGAVMLDTQSDNEAVKATAFNDSKNGTFTIVMINNALEDKEVTLDLKGQNIPGSFDAYLTSESENCSTQGVKNADEIIVLPGRSVITLTGKLPGEDSGIAPVITKQPASAVVTEGEGALFTAEAVGTPELTFQWYKNGQAVAGETGGTYRIKAAKLTENGLVITVKITNAYGEVISEDAVLSVNEFTGVKIDYAAVAPVIDGSIDPFWEGIQANEMNKKVIGEPEPENFSGNVKAAWDEDYLYLLYDITDDVLVENKDDVELFFDSDNSKGSSYGADDFQFVFKYGNPNAEETKHKVVEGVTHTSVATEKGYLVEARIPWTMLKMTPEADKMVGLDFAADDTDEVDRAYKIAWNTEDNDIWQRPSFMGVGKLMAKETEGPGPVPEYSGEGGIVSAPVVVNGSTIAVTPQTSGSSAGLTLEKDPVDKAVNAAQTNPDGTKKITIDLKAVSGIDEYFLQLPAEFFKGEGPREKAEKLFEIKTPSGTVVLLDNMFAQDALKDAKNAGIIIKPGNAGNTNPDAKEKIGERPVVEISVTIDGKEVPWKNNHVPVSISIPYKPLARELKNPDAFVVWSIDEKGNVHPVPNGRYDAAADSVTFTMSQSGTYAIVYNFQTFADAGNFGWAKKQIEMVASKGIMGGMTDEYFMPDRNITRAGFVDALVRALGLTAEFSQNFSDVDAAGEYYQSVGIAKALGITAGTGNGKFSPDAEISRQEMAVLVAKALKKAGKLNAAGTAADLEGFSDSSRVAGYAVEALAQLVNEGILMGTGENIDPAGRVSRAQAAIIAYKVYYR